MRVIDSIEAGRVPRANPYGSLIIGALLIVSAMAPVRAAPPSAASPQELECLIEPNQTVELRSQVDGVIESIAVDRSDYIKVDQVLVRLRADVEKAALAVAKAQAEHDRRKQARAAELFKQKAIPESDMEDADSKAQLSDLQMRQQAAVVAQFTLKSPVNGVVAERYLAPGESVQDKAILKLVQLDPLKIEVVAPAAWFGSIRPGMLAEVRPEIVSAGPLTAKVVVVDRVIDAASGTFGVRLELPNPEHAIPSGLRCKVRMLPAR